MELDELVRKRTMQLEEAMQVKNRFIATMSHEMRTPLSGVMGALSLLSDTPLSAEQRDIGTVVSLAFYLSLFGKRKKY